MPRALVEPLAQVVATQPEPPRQVVLAAGFLAVATVLNRRLWPVARNVVTIAHEGGHAVAALLVRRRLRGIRLHSDTSGVTLSHGKPTGPGMVLTAAAGYVAPSIAGAVFAVLLALDLITVSLWLGVALLAAMLVAIRNVFGVVSVVLTGAVVVGVSILAAPPVQAGFAYLFAWFLLVGGVRPVVELHALRRRRLAPHSDADQLARLTRVPGFVWVAVFAVVSLAAMGAGSWLLVS